MKTLICRAGATLIGLALTVVQGLTQTESTPHNLTGLAKTVGQSSADGTGSAARFGGYDYHGPYAVAVGKAGNVYVADNQTIRMMTPSGEVMTLAGLGENPGSPDGTGSTVRFNDPFGTAVDTAGNIYVADKSNQTIRMMTPTGEVTTLAGLAGSRGSADGVGSAARFNDPFGVAVDSSGNVYVADKGNRTIRKITPRGEVTTLAGLAGSSGSADGIGSAARFNYPFGVAVDSTGTLYVADTANNTIRKVTREGEVTTLAGLAGSSGSADGIGSVARFNEPIGVAVDRSGNVYVADTANHEIRKVTPAGEVTTLAGLLNIGTNGNPIGDSKDGRGSAARFTWPRGVAVDTAGNIYVADSGNHTIRKLTSAGVVTTLAGRAGVEAFPSAANADGMGRAARFTEPYGVAVDSAGNVYVGDRSNHTIRKVTPAGLVTTLAGMAGSSGSADGMGTAARFSHPQGVAVDGAGNVYVADESNFTLRKVTPAGLVTTLAGLAGSSGDMDGTRSAARFGDPQGVAVDRAGNVYVADSANNTIRKVTPTGVVTTLTQRRVSFDSAFMRGRRAPLSHPEGVAVDRAGNLFVADSHNHAIQKVTPTGVVTLLAGGNGSADGTGSAAGFNFPSGVAVDNAGNAYVADKQNSTIRRVTPAGEVTTLAGRAGAWGWGDGTGSAARFAFPVGVAVDSLGSVYVADVFNLTINKVTPVGTNWVVTTLAGRPRGVRSATAN